MAPLTDLPQEAAARDAAQDGALYAWVQPLYVPILDRRTRTFRVSDRRSRYARLWVDRRGQKPTETVFSLEILTVADAHAVADAINRGNGGAAR